MSFCWAPPCTETGVPIKVGFEIGAGMSFTVSDCVPTDFGVASTFEVGLAGIFKMGFLGVFIVTISLLH